MLSDWELWAVANRLMQEHGDTAAGVASLKATEMEAQGDERGKAVWMAVAERINRLNSPDGTRH